MKKLLPFLAIGALLAFLVAPMATTQPTGWLSYLLQDPQGTVQFRALDQYGFPMMIGHGTVLPTTANSGTGPMDGEVYTIHATGVTPDVQVYSSTAAAWYTFASVDIAQTFTGTQTFSGAVVANGDFTAGDNEDDTFTVDAVPAFRIKHENFGQVGCAQAFEEDLTAAVVTDAGENIILMPCSQIGVIAYRLEAPDGGALAETLAPFTVDGVLSLDTFADDVANEGVELVFGSFGPDMLGAYFDEDADVDMYAEVSVTITDFSDVDDLWFGWIVQEAYDDPPASDTFDTSALFVISDAAGDLDIETELNGGGTLNDDTGVTWGDGATHVLKVVVGADAVEFWLDGTQVTQANAVLNMEATDRAVVVFGYTIAAASDPGITIAYVEIGQEQ